MDKDEQAVVREMAKKVKRKWGAGWRVLSLEQQQAEIALEVVYHLLTADSHCGDTNEPVRILSDRYRALNELVHDEAGEPL